MSINFDDISGIRVLVVDDSAFMRAALSRMINAQPDMEVVGTACSGSDALEKIPVLDPEVVTLDLVMPGLDGLGTLRSIMTRFPRPVIMVSANTEKDAEATLDALSGGAFDCLPKRLSTTSLEITHIERELTSKIRAAAHSRRTRIALPTSRKPPSSATVEAHTPAPINPISVVAIGLSTGGPQVLEQILPKFPKEFSVPILIVQHMPLGFIAPLARRLNSCSSITVKEAAQGELLRPGTAYIAPAGLHMRVVSRLWGSDPAISLDESPRNALHIPSVDELMTSVAQMFQNRAIGVIMTGMGSDGASGMTAIYKQGGLTIGQDEASCAVYGMPKVCAQLGVLRRVLPLSDIALYIINTTQYRRRA